MQALLLAADALELVRARQVMAPDEGGTGFTRMVAVSPVAGAAGLQRADVDVQWNDNGPRSVRLSSLLWWPDELPGEETR
jgi:hypothetical protein